MRILKILCLGLAPFLLFVSGTSDNSQQAYVIFSQMVKSCDALKSARYTMEKTERLCSGKHVSTKINVKLQNNPTKVYVYSVLPTVGAEVLYVPGTNDNKLLINPNSFPYINLSLSPDNFLIRNNQHHSIREMGFRYINNVFKSNMVKHQEDFASHLSLEGEVDWKGRRCYKVILFNADYGFQNYQVQKGENLITVARKLDLSEYSLLCLNPHVDDYQDVSPGDVLRVPNSYGKTIVLYIDKTWSLPLMQSISDDKGLFEQYEISNLIVNPVFAEDEFTPEYKDYNF